MNDFWVFGYGSLMWKPGFIADDIKFARLFGYHRSLCIYSFHHRGTKQKPGLVLGLDRGGSCRGIAFHVAADNAFKTYHYLREREQLNAVYLEKTLPTTLEDGTRVQALAYVADQSHPQYAGNLSYKAIIKNVTNAKGVSGTNRDYIVNTVRKLRAIGMSDSKLELISKYLG